MRAGVGPTGPFLIDRWSEPGGLGVILWYRKPKQPEKKKSLYLKIK
jgi:hypothetical protein